MDYFRMLRELAAPPCPGQEDEGHEVSHVTIVLDHAKTHAPSSRSGSTISSHSGHSTSSKTARLDRWQPAPIPPPPTKEGGTAQCRWESRPDLGSFRKSNSSSDRQGRPSTSSSLSKGPKLPQRTNSQRKGRDIALSATKKPPSTVAASGPQLPKRCLSNDSGDSCDCSAGRPSFRKGPRPGTNKGAPRSNSPAA